MTAPEYATSALAALLAGVNFGLLLILWGGM